MTITIGDDVVDSNGKKNFFDVKLVLEDDIEEEVTNPGSPSTIKCNFPIRSLPDVEPGSKLA